MTNLLRQEHNIGRKQEGKPSPSAHGSRLKSRPASGRKGAESKNCCHCCQVVGCLVAGYLFVVRCSLFECLPAETSEGLCDGVKAGLLFEGSLFVVRCFVGWCQLAVGLTSTSTLTSTLTSVGCLADLLRRSKILVENRKENDPRPRSTAN